LSKKRWRHEHETLQLWWVRTSDGTIGASPAIVGIGRSPCAADRRHAAGGHDRPDAALTVDVNGQVSEFSLRSFSTIRIRAGTGNDRVTIGTIDNPIDANAFVSAGDGDDTVVTSAGDDSVEGGGGDDAISTSGGNDVIHGGAGQDMLFGGDGNDRLLGDNNADVIFGNAGADSIRGGRGDDELHDGLDKDTIFGDAGNDHFCVAEGRKEFRDTAKTEAMTTDRNSEAELTASHGSSAAGTGVVIRYMLAGDASLDGNVDFNDLVRLAQNYNTSLSSSTDSWWNGGDFTYDGITDFNDLVKLAQNYNEAVLPTPGATDPAQFAKDLADAFAKAAASS
jgi:Ca2+-binding RTX toxin-like protein